MASRKQHIQALAVKQATGEPDVSKLLDDENYLSMFAHVCNWYSANRGRKDAVKFVREYVKKNRSQDELKALDHLSDTEYGAMTYGWMCRTMSRGGNLSAEHKGRLEYYIDEIINKGKVNSQTAPVEVAETTKKVIDIQAAMKEKIQEYLGELEGELDGVFFGGGTINLYDNMRAKQLPAAYVEPVREWAKVYLAQYLDILKGEDEQLVEGYSHLNKNKIKQLAKMFHSFIEDCDKYEVFKKANRKTRAVREKTPTQQTKGIKYKIEDTELKIKSLHPTEMIGASQVWLYNTKTKKLSKYSTESSRGIQAKGSALQNWEPDMSKQKTLRKPEETIKELMAAGKVKLRTFLNELKTKEQNVNGRLNTDTIILRVTR
jgi:polyhydroxyalkanoate synthesis regulator phasin